MSADAAHYAVILAGGKGERFWPLSTARHPKQVLALVHDKPLLAEAVDRLEGLIPPERVLVITSADLVDVVRAAAPSVPPENIVGEPVGRDTAAAIALGAALVRVRAPDAAMCVLTADHVIGDLPLFRETLAQSLALAQREPALITIGIRPVSPSTGYGYIEAGDALPAPGAIAFRRARRFVEKPDEPTARRYVDAGSYFWNSGMFIWSLDTLAAALQRHAPHLAALMSRLAYGAHARNWPDLLAHEFDPLPKISIDYALMEKADHIIMAEGRFAWDDVGAWPALANHLPADDQGNCVLGDAEALDAAGNIILSRDRLTAVIGVNDLVVVQADGVTLVCPKSRAQDVKKMVERLRAQPGRGDVL